ncbi:MAG: signal recognition particle protein, partial [Candidatus Xenobia bacterium]
SEELASMIDPKAFGRIEAIIYSMTPGERRNPRILNASRRKRIAAGSGMEVSDVNRLMTQFDQMKKMMKMFGGGGGGGRRRRGGPMRLPFFPR